MDYKVLTINEPWATLLVHRIKKIETRPKPTSWTFEKGSYLIHSAKKWTKYQRDICLSEPFKSELQYIDVLEHRYSEIYNYYFNFGHIIGAVDVVECEKIINNNNSLLKLKPHYFNGLNKEFRPNMVYIQEPELSFGDYRDGRYAWICDNFRLLEKPIPYKGGQGYYVPFKGDVNRLKFK